MHYIFKRRVYIIHKTIDKLKCKNLNIKYVINSMFPIHPHLNIKMRINTLANIIYSKTSH